MSSFNTVAELVEFDRIHVWHPYSTVTDPPPIFAVASAAGASITLEDGRELVDGMASWWSVIHGYGHPHLNRALHEQVDKFAHIMFGGLTHRPAVELAKRLIDITPKPLTKVFFADSGSVAVEVAIKMAIQYWAARDKPKKQRLLTVRGGYHGDTFGAMAVCDPVTGMHSLFREGLAENFFADRPAIQFHERWQDDACADIARLIEKHKDVLAAVIIEPIVQGAGGMRFYHPEYLRAVRALCDAHDTLLIFDEIATGFGRSGKLFACEHAAVAPDIMCLGKALTGGYMTLAATLCSDLVANAIGEADPGVFMHGPTFMANPLACAVANASIELLLDADWQTNVARIETILRRELTPCTELANVTDVRVLGAIGVVELNAPVDMQHMPRAFVGHGVWIRPFGRLVYVMPPYVISDFELLKLTSAIKAVVEQLPGASRQM